MDGYGNLIAARLRKLAAARSTGMLPFSGDNDGAICLSDGKVVFAHAKRTPGPSVPEGLEPALAGGRPDQACGRPDQACGRPDQAGGRPDQAGGRPYQAGGWPDLAGTAGPFGRLGALLAATEPTLDAAVELLSSESRYGKFRPVKTLGFSPARCIPLEWLLAEVARRQHVLRQLSAVLTPDTTVVRDPQLSEPGIKVSARQWAVLIRVRDGTTPRDLAWELSRSVFGTTAEVYRLLMLRLLSAADQPAESSEGAGPGGGRATGPVLSFIRAVSREPVNRGGDD